MRKVWAERNPSLDKKEIYADMGANFSSHVLKYVPRVVPPPEVSLPRYDNVIETFKRVRDGATGTFFCVVVFFFCVLLLNPLVFPSVQNDCIYIAFYLARVSI